MLWFMATAGETAGSIGVCANMKKAQQPESSPKTNLKTFSPSEIIFQVNYIRCLFYVFVQVRLIFGDCRYFCDSLG